jgi:hypothetical protein
MLAARRLDRRGDRTGADSGRAPRRCNCNRAAADSGRAPPRLAVTVPMPTPRGTATAPVAESGRAPLGAVTAPQRRRDRRRSASASVAVRPGAGSRPALVGGMRAEFQVREFRRFRRRNRI